MNMFANAAREDSTHTYTENGAQALNTTKDDRLDFFAVVGALRQADDQRIVRLFENAYQADPLFATKILFYGRDIREGLGERSTFRKILAYAASRHPEAIRPNIDLIGEYGRWDDLYALVGTSLEDDMWAAMKKQWDADIHAMMNGKPISLLAKWVKTADASSEKTRKLGILTAKKLGLPVREYKRTYRVMRRQIKVVEQLMSQNKWREINYSGVPSRAMKLYRSAFKKHDPSGFGEFLSKVERGEAKINASTLYPYDVVREYLGIYNARTNTPDPVIEEQWKQMVSDFGNIDVNAIVVADTSGSMYCNNAMPIASSLALATMLATVNKGAFHNLFMEFSTKSRFIQLKGNTLLDQIRNIVNIVLCRMEKDCTWGMSTNLEGAFKRILEVAVGNQVPASEMPKALLVISDMEIDYCLTDHGKWSFHDTMAAEFAKHGYELPTIVYWNVDSRHDTFHVDADKPGAILISGSSASSFKQVMECISMTPVEAMEKIINGERYNPITVD